MTGPESDFVLDRVENPHEDMLVHVLAARDTARSGHSDAVAYWRGCLDTMAKATGCPASEIEAWMDRRSQVR